MSKVVICLSGGMDSCVLLWHLMNSPEVEEVRCLSVDYGQRHKKELLSAASIAAQAMRSKIKPLKQHIILDLSCIQELMLGSSQTSKDIEVPEGHYAQENMKLTVVPNRNAIFLSLAAAWAMSTKSDSIALAVHGGDHFIYWDCRPKFTICMNSLLACYDEEPKVQVTTPFLNWDKAKIAARGLELKAPLHLTRTCYKSEEKSCGRCGSCCERLISFHSIGETDPIEYEDREYYKSLAK